MSNRTQLDGGLITEIVVELGAEPNQEMKAMRNRTKTTAGACWASSCWGWGSRCPGPRAQAAHDIRGITGQPGRRGQFNLYASPFNISLPEGTSLYMWGFGDLNGGAGATHPEGNGLLPAPVPGADPDRRPRASR